MATRQAIVIPPQGGKYLSWLDAPVEYLAVGDDTADRYAFSRAVCGGRSEPTPHRHAFDEGFYVLAGEVTFTAAGDSVVVPEGAFINIRGGATHTFRNSGATRAELLIVVAPAGFERFQFEVGEGMVEPEETLIMFGKEQRRAMEKLAPKYHVELDPPDDAPQPSPPYKMVWPREGKTIAVVGDKYRFLVEGEDTDGKYAIWHATVEPGGGPPPHLQTREDEAFYVLRGEVAFTADGQRHVAGGGTFVHVPADSPHQFKNETEQPAEMLILVAPAGMEKLFEQIGTLLESPADPTPHPTQEQFEKLKQLAPDFGIELKV
ncbi:MAG: cupin domain-containing protein [Pirellulales bacterium]